MKFSSQFITHVIWQYIIHQYLILLWSQDSFSQSSLCDSSFNVLLTQQKIPDKNSTSDICPEIFPKSFRKAIF